MKWFLGLVLVVALVAGALYGVGTLLLPNNLSVTRAIKVDRPRATVFAMSNDLRIVKEWSPYYARDPDAEYSFSGEAPGAGQTMRWASDVRQVGNGRMSIVRSSENQLVETILELGDRAILNTRLDLARQPENDTAVSWSVSAECARGYINVPCRYMNLIMRRMIERDLDDGLARLKTLSEQLPDVDFEGYTIAPEVVNSQSILFVDVTIANASPTFEDRDSAERQGVAALNQFLAASGGQITREGTLVRVFPANNGAGGRYSFSVGYPYSGPTPLLIGVRVGQTPAGEALHASVQGRRSQIPMMYQRLDAYMRAHRIQPRPDTEAWEIVHRVEPAVDATHPNDPVERTEIFYPMS